MSDDNGTLIHFAKKISILGGAVIVAGTIVGWLSGFLWGYATQPIMTELRSLKVGQIEETRARQYSDSLLVEQLANVARAVSAPRGSAVSTHAVREATQAPEEWQHEQAQKRRR